MFTPHETIVMLATRPSLLFLPFQGFQPIQRLVSAAYEKAGLSFNGSAPALTTSSLWRWPDIDATITLNHLQMKHSAVWDGIGWMDGIGSPGGDLMVLIIKMVRMRRGTWCKPWSFASPLVHTMQSMRSKTTKGTSPRPQADTPLPG